METYQDCLHRLLKKVEEEQNSSSEQTQVFDKIGDGEISELRLSAIRRGLGFIYKVSKDDVVFNTFGNDIIQCYYDISRVS